MIKFFQSFMILLACITALEGNNAHADYLAKLADYAQRYALTVPALTAFCNSGDEGELDDTILQDMVVVIEHCSLKMSPDAFDHLMQENDAFFASLENDPLTKGTPQYNKLKINMLRAYNVQIDNNLTVGGNTILNNLTVNGTISGNLSLTTTTICGVPACTIAQLISGATSADMPDTLVLRDNTGSFASTTLTLTGALELQAPDASGTISLSAPDSVTTYAITLPATEPAGPSQTLVSDGSGGLSWETIQTSSSGIVSINNLRSTIQFLTTSTGPSTAFAWIDTGSTHQLNIPYAANVTGANVGLITGQDYQNFQNTYTTVAAATSLDIPNTLVKRDGSGNFSAGTITANLTGTATYATNALSAVTSTSALYATNALFSTTATWAINSGVSAAIQSLNGLTAANQFLTTTTAGTALQWNQIGGNTNQLQIPYAGNVTGNNVGLITGANYQNFQNTYTTVLAATALDTPSTLVLRNGSGNFAAGTITANLTGTATYATNALLSVTAQYATASLSAITSTSSVYATTALFSTTATWVINGGGSSSGIQSLNGLTAANQFLTTSSAGTSFTWVDTGSTHQLTIPYAGNVTGANVGLITGADYQNFENTYTTVLAATSLDIPNTLVKRDGSGNFAAGTITANLTGTATYATNALLSVTAQYATAALSAITSTSAVYATTALFSTTATWVINSGVTSAIQSLNGLTAANQFLTTSSAGTSFTWVDTGSTHQLTIPYAANVTGANVGLITGANYQNFENTYTIVAAANSLDVPSTLVLRDNTGSFASTTITLTGNSLINYSTNGNGASGQGYIWAPIGNANTFVGLGNTGNMAGQTINGNNTAFGYAALNTLSTGYWNTAIGSNALQPTTSGYYNTAVGVNALGSNNIGFKNTAIGTSALQYSTSGKYNTALGDIALYQNTIGAFNTAVGQSAMSLNTTGSYNTAVGWEALNNNTSGQYNTAIGEQAMSGNTTGIYNVAVGQGALGAGVNTGRFNCVLGPEALFLNTTGYYNIAIGIDALYSNTSGQKNVAVGGNALYSTQNGQFNNAIGQYALYLNTGSANNAIGDQVLYYNTTGSNNIALGRRSGFAYTGSESYNILLGTQGVIADQNTTRIGYFASSGVSADLVQTSSCFIAGIYGANPGGSSSEVFINSSGQLSTISSSSRYKTDIQDMGEVTADLIKLRPVTFKYKAHPESKSRYGLVAEEVGKYYPDIVIYNENGEAETVQYHYLPAMLLNEWKKDHQRIDELERQLNALMKKNGYELPPLAFPTEPSSELQIMNLLASQDAPRTYLFSYPRSGSTWVRYCIENLTQRPTAEYSPDINISHQTFLPLGLISGHAVDLSKAAVWKVHTTRHLDFADSRHNPDQDSLIFLLRNPKEALARQTSSEEKAPHNDSLSLSGIPLINVKWYFDDLEFFENWKGKKILIYYEDLIKNPRETLKKIMHFLGESDAQLENFFKDFEHHKLNALALYDLLGGSQSKGKEIDYHSQKMSLSERKRLDKWMKLTYTHLWEKYLKSPYCEE